MRIDIRSALAGAGAFALVLGLASFAQQTQGVPKGYYTQLLGGPLHVVVDALPERTHLFEIRAPLTAPYTVPAGKTLVLTGLGCNDDQGPLIDLYLDGAVEARLKLAADRTFGEVLPNRPITAGTVLELDSGSGPATTARAWGYLVDA